MAFTSANRKDRRRKAIATLPGQRGLDGVEIPAARLPVKIPTEVHTIFFGLGPGLDSAESGRYFPGTNNYFWKLLFRSGIWPHPIKAENDDQILAEGFGLADVIERPTKGTVLATKAEYLNAKARVRNLVAKHKPKLVVFVGLRAYRTYLRREDVKVEYGEQLVGVGNARIFVLPSTSGASAAITTYADKLDWFKRLAALIKTVRNQE